MVSLNSKTTWMGFTSILFAIFQAVTTRDVAGAVATLPAALGLLFAADQG